MSGTVRKQCVGGNLLHRRAMYEHSFISPFAMKVALRKLGSGLSEAGVRSFIITFDVYVILNAFKNYDNKRPRILLKPINFVVLAK